MTIRWFKIAVSALSVFACLVFVALWVRSYWVGDTIRLNVLGRIVLASREGTVFISARPLPLGDVPALEWNSTRAMMPAFGPNPSWGLRINNDGMSIRFPYRLPIVACILIAIVPWPRWHYSMRTMLIVTALIAIALGLALYF
jgi:hypothetical protein